MKGQAPADDRQNPMSNINPACLHNPNINLPGLVPTGLSLNTATMPPAQGPDPRAAQAYNQTSVYSINVQPATAQAVAQVVVMLAAQPAIRTHVLQLLQQALQSRQQNAPSASLPPSVPEMSCSQPLPEAQPCHVPIQHAPVQDNRTQQAQTQQQLMTSSQQQLQQSQKQFNIKAPEVMPQAVAQHESEAQQYKPPKYATAYGSSWYTCNATCLKLMVQTLSSMEAGTLSSAVYAALMLAGPQGMDKDDLAKSLTANGWTFTNAALRRICATEPSITCLTPGVFTTTAYYSDRHPERGVACPLQPYSQPEMQVGQQYARASTIVVDDITARLSKWRGAAHVAAMNWLAGKGETPEQTLARINPGTFKCAVFKVVKNAGPKGTQAPKILQALRGSRWEYCSCKEIRGACVSDPAIIRIGPGTYAATALIEKQSGARRQDEVGTGNQPDSSLQEQAQQVGCNRLSTMHAVLQQEQPVVVANQCVADGYHPRPVVPDKLQPQLQLPADQGQHETVSNTIADETALQIRSYSYSAQKVALEWLAGKVETPEQTLARLGKGSFKHAVFMVLLKAGPQGMRTSDIGQALDHPRRKRCTLEEIRRACTTDPSIIRVDEETYAARTLLTSQFRDVEGGDCDGINQVQAAQTDSVVQRLTDELQQHRPSPLQGTQPQQEQGQHQHVSCTIDDETALQIRNYCGSAQKAALEWLAGKVESPEHTLARLQKGSFKQAVFKVLLQAGPQGMQTTEIRKALDHPRRERCAREEITRACTSDPSIVRVGKGTYAARALLASQPHDGSTHQVEDGQCNEGAINSHPTTAQESIECDAHAVVVMGFQKQQHPTTQFPQADAGTSKKSIDLVPVRHIGAGDSCAVSTSTGEVCGITDVPQLPQPQLASTHQQQPAASKSKQGMPDQADAVQQGKNNSTSQPMSTDSGQASQINLQTILRSLHWPLSYEHAQALHDMLQCLKDGTDMSPYEDAQCMTVHELMEELNRQELDWDMVAADLEQDVDVDKLALLQGKKATVDTSTAAAIRPTTTPSSMNPPGVQDGEVDTTTGACHGLPCSMQQASADNVVANDKGESTDGTSLVDHQQPVVAQPIEPAGTLETVHCSSTEILNGSCQAALSRYVAALHRQGLSTGNALLQPSQDHQQCNTDEVMGAAAVAAAATVPVKQVGVPPMDQSSASCSKRPRHSLPDMQDYVLSLHKHARKGSSDHTRAQDVVCIEVDD